MQHGLQFLAGIFNQGVVTALFVVRRNLLLLLSNKGVFALNLH